MSNYNCLTMMILRKCRANYEELTSLINTDFRGDASKMHKHGDHALHEALGIFTIHQLEIPGIAEREGKHQILSFNG